MKEAFKWITIVSLALIVIIAIAALFVNYWFLGSINEMVGDSKKSETALSDSTLEGHAIWRDDPRMCFYYYTDSVTPYEDKHLITPVIEVPKNNTWNQYRLRQLDSMIAFAIRFPTFSFSIDLYNINTAINWQHWGTESDVLDYVKRYVERKYAGVNNIFTSQATRIPICTNVDSMLIRQNRDSIYYLIMSKIPS